MNDPAYFVRVLNFLSPINLQTCNKNRLLVVKSRTFAFGANLGLAKYELLGAHHFTSCKNSCIMCLPCVVPFCRSVLSYLVLTLRLGSDLCFCFHPWGHKQPRQMFYRKKLFVFLERKDSMSRI